MFYVPGFLYIEEAPQWKINNKHKQTKNPGSNGEAAIVHYKKHQKLESPGAIWQDERWPKYQLGYLSS